jgi:lipopolysaccharide export system protein LptC
VVTATLQERLERLAAWTPVFVLAGLAALTYWLDSQIDRNPRAADGRTRHDPDLVIEDFNGTSLGPDGRIRQQVTARRARHFPDDNSTELDDATFVSLEPGKPRLRVSAARGILAGDRDSARFAGNVTAIREEAGADQPMRGPLKLVTEELNVVSSTQKLWTAAPVTITEPRAIIRGTGLEYDHEARTLRILSNVSGEFTPAK